MASAEQTMEMIRLTVTPAVAEALKQLNFASAGVGGEDGGRSGGEGRMLREDREIWRHVFPGLEVQD